MNCELCSETNVSSDHVITEKHIRNKALFDYALFRKQNVGNRKGVVVSCNVESGTSAHAKCFESKIKVSAKPNEVVKFSFNILNDNKKDKILLHLVLLTHFHPYFSINNHGFNTGSTPHCIEAKSELDKDIKVVFKSDSIGQYKMTIIFCFFKNNSKENIIIVREMIVYSEKTKSLHNKIISPFTFQNVVADKLYRCNNTGYQDDVFPLQKKYKTIFRIGLDKKANMIEVDMKLVETLRNILDTGVTKQNYVDFFHTLLWYEETILQVNLKKYNMTGVELRAGEMPSTYVLTVPGLAEKRPSLLLHDILFIKPQNANVMFEGQICKMNDDILTIQKVSEIFRSHFGKNAKFDIRFTMRRVTLERMHRAVHYANNQQIVPRLFPEYNAQKKKIKPIKEFFNPLIAANPEQSSAVEHIVGRSSGLAPYLVHGPPGTGKTVTIVEAILQLVSMQCANRILVCTDSNMAADHVATLLVKYADKFASNFLLRANAEFRPWEIMPKCLIPFSNGSSTATYQNVTVTEMMGHMIVITTLSHAAKFSRNGRTKHISHLFIDEAAQASEPASLIPLCGLLASTGAVVLAGDPLQLGPVIISHDVKTLGLGLSLMERLMNSYPMYDDEIINPKYMVRLRNNFRSDPDILSIPNELFYKGQLRALAKEDPLSKVDLSGERISSRAIVFHGVLSQEGKVGMSPSFFNKMEMEVVQMYINFLVKDNHIKMEDIGVIAPYIRQVFYIKQWLIQNNFDKIEVGTVEAFQGKEKRVIIISTVRANADLLQHDAKYQLGFLVDGKRFNVALTRAKAKAIIIGNPLCLEKDKKWSMYIQRCRELGTYFGFDSKKVKIDGEVDKMIDLLLPMFKEACTLGDN